MNYAEWQDQRHAEPVWIDTKEHLGKKFAQDIKENHRGGQGSQQEAWPLLQPSIHCGHSYRKYDQVGYDVSYKNRPQKIFGIFKVLMECRRARVAGTPLLPDSDRTQGENPRFHPRQQERD